MAIQFKPSGGWSGITGDFVSVEDVGAHRTITSARMGNAWEIQDANASDSSKRPCWGLTTERMNNCSGIVLLQGFVTDSSWTWTPGAILYLSDTDGGMSETPGTIKQEVGWSLTAKTIYFDPKSVTYTVPE